MRFTAETRECLKCKFRRGLHEGVDDFVRTKISWMHTIYRVFSLTWPASMQTYWNKRKRLHKKRVQLPEDWFGTPTWPPFHCFGTPIWPPWRHVKTLYWNSREVKHHVYVKRQTRICTTWPSLPLTCRVLFIISTHKLVVSRTDFLSTRIVLTCFYLLIKFCFEKFSTWIWSFRLPYKRVAAMSLVTLRWQN